MSYDMSIGSEAFNYTYNVASMWYEYFPEKGIRNHYGMSGAQALISLRNLRDFMENNQQTLELMNPDNDWGDYRGALNFVQDLILASIKYPDEIWEGD